MAFSEKRIPAFSLLALLLLAGCGRVHVDESMPAEEAWALAKQQFEHENYLDVVDILNTFTLNYSGSSLIDSAQFLLGESHFGMGEYILAESEYLRLTQNFPESPLVDDARLKIILCNLYLSPTFSHDQKYAERTVTLAQDFLQDFPTTDLALRLTPRRTTWEGLRQVFTLGLWRPVRGDIKKHDILKTRVVFAKRSRGFGNWFLNVITFGIYPSPEPELKTPWSQEVSGDWAVQRSLFDSQARLAQKSCKTAELYYTQGKYPSAVIYCDRVLDLYSESAWAQPALRLKGNAQYAMGDFASAEQTYDKFLKQFGASGHEDVKSKWEASQRRLRTTTKNLSNQSNP